jgi:hypothetical protein
VPVPSDGTIGQPETGQVIITGSFGKAFGPFARAPDCSQVEGCNQANCEACINLFWATQPQLCTPGCLNLEIGANNELRAELADRNADIKEPRSQLLLGGTQAAAGI